MTSPTGPAPEPLWYRVQLDRQTIRPLQGRTNIHGLLNLAAYLGLLLIFGLFAVMSWLPTPARVVAFLCYALVFCFSEAIIHETHHRTAFRSTWLNEMVHHGAGVLLLKDPIRDRWMHAAHHTYTSFPGLDPELFLEPPPKFSALLLDIFRLRMFARWFWASARNAVNRPDPLTVLYVPPTEHRKVTWSARACLLVYALAIAASIGFQTWWPVLLLPVARLVGGPSVAFLMMPQHGALPLELADWRLSTRTILVNRFARLLMWNMNYHLEHHMNPTVPFHNLPKLHQALAEDCPVPYPSASNAWREMLPALWRQRKDPTYAVKRPLPSPQTGHMAMKQDSAVRVGTRDVPAGDTETGRG